MEFEVNANNVILKQIDQIESGEYNITECNFVFSNEYDGLTKIAVFTGENGDTYKITILNNKCEIPSELLTTSQIVQIGVYAYEVQGTEFVLRYSPMPTRFMIEKGSYVVNAVNMSRPTPTEVEQLQSQITHNANDIEDLQQNVSENTTAIENLQNDVGDIQTEQTEQNTKIQKNTDDIVAINQSIGTINTEIGEINQDINNLETNKADKSQLSVYSLITETGSQIELNINTTNYKMKSILKDKNGNAIFTSNEIDLPLESFVVSATYDNTTKEIVLTLQNGQTIRFSVADLVSGLVSEDDLQTILANYYTETQIDNLLNNKVDKIQGKGLSTEDFTTAEKTKLEGIEAEANKTIVDNELDNTSENPVQNKVIYEALSEKQTEINNLQTDVEDLRNASVKVTGTGTDITLNNTAKGRLLDIELKGQTSQVQLEGKNLALFSSMNVGTLTGTLENQIATINGTTANAMNTTFFLNNSDGVVLEANKTYVISVIMKGTVSGSGYRVIYFAGQNIGNVTSNTTRTFVYTPSENKTVKNFIFDLATNTSFTDFTIKVQIEEGSTATEYEQYCGGIPSPSPSFPQQIKNVTGNANVFKQNKNLALNDNPETPDSNYSSSGGGTTLVQYSNSENGYFTTNHRARNFGTLKAGTYTLSLSAKSRTEGGSGFTILTGIKGYADNIIAKASLSNNYSRFSYTFTITESKNFNVTFYNTLYWKDIQLEEGTTATSYVPHAEQNLPFTFEEGQFLADDEELQDNGIYNEWGEKIFDGTEEGWTYGVESGYSRFSIGVPEMKIGNNLAGLCNYFTNSHFVYTEGRVRFGWANKTVYFYCNATEFPDLATWKTWLTTHNVVIEYILENPTTIAYNSTQAAQYEAIKNARSYADKTIISSTSDEEGFDMYVEAIGDANKVMQSELQEIKSAVIALGGDLNV